MEDNKVETILNAARKRFAHYGIAKTTMNEIASDINMSKASLYYYFPDKERIFVAVVEKDINEFVGVIQVLINKSSKASFKLKKYIAMRNELLNRLLNLAKVEKINPGDVFNPVFDDLKKSFFVKEKQLIAQILQMGIDDGEFSKCPVNSYSDLFVTTLAGLRSVIFSISADISSQERVADQSILFGEIFLKSIRIQ